MKKGDKNPNAGRKPGSKNKSTIAREIALEDFKELGRKHAAELFAIQLELAKGIQILHWRYKLMSDLGNGRTGFLESSTTDKNMIKKYLDGDLDQIEKSFDKTYWLETKEPNNQALDSILNRTFGKPTEVVEMQSPGGGNFWDGFMQNKKPNVLAKENG